MSKITINTCLNELKKKKEFILPIHEDIQLVFNDEAHPIDKMEAGKILEIVAQLPEHYREVFNMAAIDGFSHKEIGELLGVTELVSRTRLKRARNIIKLNFTKLINYTSWEKTI
jgi:RNA polymerase sigma-70 factor (ECF subfamily)